MSVDKHDVKNGPLRWQQQAARRLMKENPGMKYTQALRKVKEQNGQA